jgi:hypothetical protein
MSKFMQFKKWKSWFLEHHLDVLLISALLFFFVDGWINQYFHAPLMTLYAGIASVLMLANLLYQQSLPRILLLFLSGFAICNLYHWAYYGFSFRSASDVVYILLFVTSFYHFDRYKAGIHPNRLWLISLVFIGMLAYSFIGLKSETWKVDKSEQIEVSQAYLLPEVEESTGEIISTIGGRIEKNRIYIRGLYRHAHVGAVLLGFCLLCFVYFRVSTKLWLQWLMGIVLLICTIFTGARIFFAALGIAFLILAIQRKYWVPLIIFLVSISLTVLFRFEIYDQTQNTPFGSLSGALIAFIDDWRHISRIQIWNVWVHEVASFSMIDHLLGKSLQSSLDVNYSYFNRKIWFHSDLPSIYYAYGILIWGLMMTFYWEVWNRFFPKLRAHSGLFMFLLILLICSLLNGLYYYQPLFFFYLLFAMEKSELSPIGFRVKIPHS